MSFETHILPLIIYVLFSFPGGSEVNASASSAGDLVFDPWVRKIPWWRKWQPTPVFLLGKSHGWRSLVGYSPWHHKESNMTEQFHFHFLFNNFLYFIGQRRKDIWLQKRKELWGWKREVLVIEEGVTNQRIIWPPKGKKGKEMDYPLDLKKEWTLSRPWLWTVKWI